MQVMYAYVMGPQTLPHSYWQFIVKSGPVSPVVLEAVRRNNRGLLVDVDAVNRCRAGVRDASRHQLHGGFVVWCLVGHSVQCLNSSSARCRGLFCGLKATWLYSAR